MREVIVVIGAGSIGQAIARRVSAGKQVVLADLHRENADAAAEVMHNAGFDVSTATVDVSSRESVRALVETATTLGDVTGVIHAAGVSPSGTSRSWIAGEARFLADRLAACSTVYAQTMARTPVRSIAPATSWSSTRPSPSRISTRVDGSRTICRTGPPRSAPPRVRSWKQAFCAYASMPTSRLGAPRTARCAFPTSRREPSPAHSVHRSVSTDTALTSPSGPRRPRAACTRPPPGWPKPSSG
jgi:short chain dehydrogenase